MQTSHVKKYSLVKYFHWFYLTFVDNIWIFKLLVKALILKEKSASLQCGCWQGDDLIVVKYLQHIGVSYCAHWCKIYILEKNWQQKHLSGCELTLALSKLVQNCMTYLIKSDCVFMRSAPDRSPAQTVWISIIIWCKCSPCEKWRVMCIYLGRVSESPSFVCEANSYEWFCISWRVLNMQSINASSKEFVRSLCFVSSHCGHSLSARSFKVRHEKRRAKGDE